MQSLDSSCQEADFIINDALLKLKGSAVQSNNSSSLRQQQQQQQHHHHHHQFQTLQQHQQSQSHASHLLQNANTTLNLNRISQQQHQTSSSSTSPYIFDSVDLPPDYIALPTNLIEHDLETVGGVVVTTATDDLSNSINSPTSLLSNINSIISPSPVVPDVILSTSSVSSTSPTLNCSSPLSSALKPEKRSLVSDTNSINLYNASSTTSTSTLGTSISSPAKRSKFSNNSSPVAAVVSASQYTQLSSPPPPPPPTSSSSLLQPPLQINSPISVTSINSNTTDTSSLTQQQQQTLNAIKTEIRENSNVVVAATPQNTSYNTIPSTSTGIHTSLSTSSQHQSLSHGMQSVSANGGINVNETGTVTTTTSSTNTSSLSSSFFDIHDKIKELYFYLLLNDEKSLKESRRRHRTRSFVLERLVEREKLNTIVLNLYPGNKGYSLAAYCHDNNNSNNSNKQQNENESLNSSSATDYGSSTLSDRGGNGGNNRIIIGTNGSSSRLKQTQIVNNNSSNSLSSNNNNQGSDDTLDRGGTITRCRGGSGNFVNISDTKITNNQNDINSMTTSTSTMTDNNKSNTITATTTTPSTDNNDGDDKHLIEIMRWPCYEIEDLLISIDNEELPILFSDILETRVPNVFYSGCVICQIRDFRQTFPISSNSCDIYHVLLKPTNEILYSDINQLAIDYDISPDDKLQLESQLILATSEPLCLDPNPIIGQYAINNQYQKQIWNTQSLRRQMKKYSQISINRKRKIDQFTHNYGLELCDYLQRLRQRPTAFASFASKLPKKPIGGIIKPIRTPNLDYPSSLSIPPADDINVEKYAKAYERPRETKDCMPQLIEEYILETDREGGRVYHIKLSIFQRPANSEYLGELYVDKDYKEGERNGEACQFSLGTRSHANRYIQQFTEIFTEEGRKSVKITHIVPGQPPKVSCTTGMTEYRKQQQQQQQQAALAAALQQQQQQQQQHQLHQQQLAAAQQQQHQQIQIQQAIQQATPQLISTTPTISSTTNPNALSANQLNINLQGNIVGIATTAGNIQHLRQANQQLFDGATVSVQTQPTQQLNLSNGSLVLLQQQGTGQGITIQTASTNQQKATQILTNAAGQLTGNTIRTQLASSVPILQAQLKAAPAIVTASGQQQILQQKITPTTIHSANQTINALVTGFMNTANQLQQQQQQQQTIQVQQQTVQQKSGNAAILSLLNSAPAAMTSTSVLGSTFNPPVGQQQATIVAQQQTHQNISTDSLLQQQQQQQHQQQSQQQRKQNEVMQSLLSNNLRKISMVSSAPGGTTTLGVTGGGSGGRTNANLIAVSAVGLNQDINAATAQNVRVTMSALASQLASPPAVMTNANFGYATNATTNNSDTIALNNSNIKILNNTVPRVINAGALRIESNIASAAVPSPGSDSNASNASGTSNLGFTMSGLSALLATSPSPGNDQSQSSSHSVSVSSGGTLSSGIASNLSNQAFLERLNNGTSVSTSPGLSPQQQHQQVGGGITKNVVQHIANVQSPAASISPLSSPPPQPSPQQSTVAQQQAPQTTTLNLQGINLQSLQGAMATFPGLQNVQVQIPGLTQPIFSLSGASLAAAVQQQANANAANQQGGGGAQQTTSLLVSVPVTSTTQVNTIQTVPPGACGTVVSAVPATAAATQTVVLTNATGASNPSGGVAGSMLSLPIAQLVASGVKGLNSQTIRTGISTGGPAGTTTQNVVNASIIQASTGGGNGANLANTNAVNTSNTVGVVGSGGGVAQQPIQLLGTLQQRPRSIQVVGTKQISNRAQLATTQQQRNLSNSSLKIANQISASQQITTTANVTASPLVMTTQKVHLKLQKPSNHQQQQQQTLIHQQQQQQQQNTHLQISTGTNVTTPSQRIMAAVAVANQNQKRRRSATDLNK